MCDLVCDVLTTSKIRYIVFYMADVSFMDKKIVPITELRRNFGGVTADLFRFNEVILTRGGKPFATLRPARAAKRVLLKAAAGMWVGTDLDNEAHWAGALKRISSKSALNL